MNRSAYAYVTVVAGLAMLFVAGLPWSEIAGLSIQDAVGVAVFATLGILAETSGVYFAVEPRRRLKSSITFLPLFACAVVFPPTVTVATAFVVAAFAELFLKRRILWRTVFNTSQYVLAYGLAASFYYTLTVEPSSSAIIEVIAFIGLAVIFFVTNNVLVGNLVSIQQGTGLLTIIRQNVGPGGGNLLYDLLASPIAIIAAILYESFGAGGLVLIILPLLLVRYSYLSKLQLQQANRDLLRVLIKAIETRDPYTSGHSVRVSTLAKAIAQDLRVPRRDIEKIETAALLHDIGKIDATYAPLIRKTSALDQAERSVIRTHATKGAELLRGLASLDEDVVQGVRHHHERYDGTGYPDQLRAKDIPLPARIIALCDAIDAMLSDRPYRSALTVDQVRAELIRCSGEQFDPDIVNGILRQNTIERAAALLADSDRVSSSRLVSQPA